MGELDRTGDNATPSEATPDKPEPGATSDTGHDAQIEAILAREDAMPDRQESAAATWGDTTDDHDTDTDTDTDTDDPGHASVDGEAVREDSTPNGISDRLSERTVESDNQRLQSDNAELGKVVAELKAENTQLVKRIVGVDSANARLEAANARLGKDVAELKAENAAVRSKNAELERGFSGLGTRLERLEQHRPDVPAGSIRDKELSKAGVTEKAAKPHPDRPDWKSNEAIGLAAVAGSSVVTTVADYWSFVPATYAGITASALGVGAATVALIRKDREARDAAHRPEH